MNVCYPAGKGKNDPEIGLDVNKVAFATTGTEGTGLR